MPSIAVDSKDFFVSIKENCVCLELLLPSVDYWFCERRDVISFFGKSPFTGPSLVSVCTNIYMLDKSKVK